MNEIIFWFSEHKIRNYWLEYAISYCKSKHPFIIKYNRVESWIEFNNNLKILFKVNLRNELDLVGLWNKNQYWVEELFDNNFEEFFKQILKENIDYGTKRNQNI